MFLVANAVDDADMGITHVIRGEDLINVTPKVLLLREALGTTTSSDLRPPAADREREAPEALEAPRRRLGRRLHRPGLPARGDGQLPGHARVGRRPTASRSARCPRSSSCSASRTSTPSGAFFDLKKLDHFNGEYIRALSIDEFVERCQPLAATPTRRGRGRFDVAAFEVMAPLVQERVKRLDEVPGYVDFLFLDAPEIDDASWEKVMEGPDAAAACSTHDRRLRDVRVGRRALEAAARAHRRDATSIGQGKAQAPVRVAVTGRTVGPPLFESLVVLGRERTLERLRRPAAASELTAPTAVIRVPRLEPLAPVASGIASRSPRLARRLYVGVTFAQVWWASRDDGAEGLDAIVVMGAAQWNGRPSPVLKARLDHAVELYEQGVAPMIVVTGGKQPGDRVTQGRTGYDYLRDRASPRRPSRSRSRAPTATRSSRPRR